jgi:hypothetical protein
MFKCEYNECITEMSMNKRCCGVADFMECIICSRLVCKIHQVHHWKEGGDRPEFTTCISDKCIMEARERL